MLKSIAWLFVPVLLGTLVGAAFQLKLGARAAFACSCVGDAFWVIDDVKVEGPALPWPHDGHLYPDSLSLWAEGQSFRVVYSK